MRVRAGRRVLAALILALVACATFISASANAATTAKVVDHWGGYISGGVADQDVLLTPTAMSLPGKVVQVASSNAANYALLSNGAVYAWGIGANGELGNGGTASEFTTPVQVMFPAGITIAKLADTSPYDTGLAIDSTGNAWGWGLDPDGQLCLGNRNEYLTPVQIPLTHVSAVAGAGDHALYVSSGNVSACGANANGDLGVGSTTPSTVPVAVSGLQSGKVVHVYTSWRNSGALLSNGSYESWGYNGLGNVGNGQLGTDALTPQLIPLPGKVSHVALGGSGSNNGQTLVLLSNGIIRAWGYDAYGQLGDDSTTTEPSPIAVSPPAGVTYTNLASGANTSYAIDSANQVWAWGNNVDGQVGDGTTTNHLLPVKVLSGKSHISTTAKDVLAF